jgi:hypothetical protein
MTNTQSGSPWMVDLKAGIAICGGVKIGFSERADEGFDIAFVSGAVGNLESQCLIAGQAAAAIKAEIRRAGMRQSVLAPYLSPVCEATQAVLEQAA